MKPTHTERRRMALLRASFEALPRKTLPQRYKNTSSTAQTPWHWKHIESAIQQQWWCCLQELRFPISSSTARCSSAAASTANIMTSAAAAARSGIEPMCAHNPPPQCASLVVHQTPAQAMKQPANHTANYAAATTPRARPDARTGTRSPSLLRGDAGNASWLRNRKNNNNTSPKASTSRSCSRPSNGRRHHLAKSACPEPEEAARACAA